MWVCVCVCQWKVCELSPVKYRDLPQERVIPQHSSSFYHTLCKDGER